ncbi:MAG: hypothetical protein M3Y85_00890, partial [Bacteroidota bacterium]|nr:hypothetical protein [Bacteroidota bacterium]
MFKRLRYSIVLLVLILCSAQAIAQMAMPDNVCVGATKIYTVNPVNPPAGSTYKWKIDGVVQTTTSNQISILWNTPGPFKLTVQETSAAGCDGDIQSGDVNVFASPTATISGSTSVCTGGSATVSVALTGEAPWSITYTDGTTPVTVNNINTSPYTFIVSPSVNTTYSLVSISNGYCSGTVSGAAVITANTKPTAVISGSTTICAGSAATLSVVLTGKAPWTITYTDGTTLVTINNINTSPYPIIVTPLANTTYSLVSMNDANCTGTVSGSETINVTQLPVASAAVTTAITCNGDKATVTITASGGTAPLSYTLNGVTNTTGVFTNVSAAASLAWSVTDANNCGPVTGTIQVAEPSAINLALTTTDVLCQGGNTGSITATFSGGTAPYTINIDGGTFTSQTSPFTFNGLTAGTHTVIVTDANNCTSSKPLVVNEIPALTVALTTTDVLCQGGNTGSVTATFSGGTGPYMINIDGGVFTTQTSPFTFSGLTAGLHTVMVTDVNTCSFKKDVTVNEIPALTLALTKTDVLCQGGNTGTITATFGGGTGPYMVNIDGGTFTAQTSPFTFTGLTSGVHEVFVTDANTCSFSQSILVSEIPSITLSLSKTDVKCNGDNTGSVTATFTGGTAPYLVNIDGGTFTAQTSPFTFTSLTAGSHIIIVKDANNCTPASQTIDIIEPGKITSQFSASGCTSYTLPWGTVVTLAGDYLHTYKSNNGCDSLVTAHIIINSPPAVPVVSITQPACSTPTGTITITSPVGTGLTYSIDGVSFQTANIFIVTAGSYTVTVKDANGCTSDTSIVITQALAPVISTQPVSLTDCYGKQVDFKAIINGGVSPYKYTWQRKLPSEVVFTDFSTTTAATTTSVLTVPNIGNVQAPNGTRYQLIITDANGCSVTSDIVTLTVNEIVDITPSNITICKGGTISFTLTTSGTTPVSYQWLRNDIPISNGVVNGVTTTGATSSVITITNATTAESGAYKVVIIFNLVDGSGVARTCQITSGLIRNAVVTNPVTPSVVIAPTTVSICTGGSVTFVATPTNGGTTPAYQWMVNGIAVA